MGGSVSLPCDVLVVFFARDGHNRGSGLFLDPGGRGAGLGCTSLSGEANTLVPDHIHMEETEVMDVLWVPSGEQNSSSIEIARLTPLNRPQNRYSLPVFILWQQIGSYLLPRHQPSGHSDEGVAFQWLGYTQKVTLRNLSRPAVAC